MGLKDDLIEAKLKMIEASGGNPDDIDTGPDSPINIECEYTKEAIANFLTTVEFKITQLKAPIVVEDFKIPDQPVDVALETLLGDKAPIIDTIKALPVPGIQEIAKALEGAIERAVKPLLKGGSTLPEVELDTDTGLESTGYVFIGEDPNSQGTFDVEDEDGQRQFTSVKLFREDIEELL